MSGLSQVPAPILLADLGHELAVLGALDCQVDLEKLLTLGIAVALDRCARIELLADAAMDTGEDRRGGQIRVGIGAADAVLDMPGIGRPTGHAQDRKSTRLN